MRQWSQLANAGSMWQERSRVCGAGQILWKTSKRTPTGVYSTRSFWLERSTYLDNSSLRVKLCTGWALHTADDMQWDVQAVVSFFNGCSLVWLKWIGYWPNEIQIIYIATTRIHPHSSRLQNSFIRSGRVRRIFTESWMNPQAMPSTKYAYPMHTGNKVSVINFSSSMILWNV